MEKRLSASNWPRGTSLDRRSCCASPDRVRNGSISPRCGPLLRLERVEKRSKAEGEGILAMTPSRQGWWSWNENTTVGQEWKTADERGKERRRRSPTLLHSSLATSESVFTFVISINRWTERSLQSASECWAVKLNTLQLNNPPSRSWSTQICLT